MKRNEMLIIMANAIKDHWYKTYSPKLKGSSYIGMSIAEAYKYAEVALDASEKTGMLPPENGKEASYIVDYRFNCLKWDEE